MALIDLSSAKFSEQLASRAATPGGGGASALVGALGAALAAMVGNLTLGKAKYADVQEEVQALLTKAEDLRCRLLTLVDADAAAFAPVMEAYALPKDAPNRPEVLETALRGAADVPFQILQLCCEAIELHEQMGKIGSAMALSDVATGVVFCWSAMYGAAVNVKVNTKLMADRTRAEELNRQVDDLMANYWPVAERVYEEVYKKYC